MIDELKEKVAHIQQELLEVQAALDEIASTGSPAATSIPTRHRVLANRLALSKGPLQAALAAMFKEMGIDSLEPIGAPKLHERMLQDGVRPEDNLFSSGIVAMRE